MDHRISVQHKLVNDVYALIVLKEDNNNNNNNNNNNTGLSQLAEKTIVAI